MTVLAVPHNPAARARRAAALAFFAGLAVVIVLAAAATSEVSASDVSARATRSVAGLTVVTVQHTFNDAGSTASLSPGVGALVLLVVLPVAIGLAVHLRLRRQAAEPA